MKEVIQRINKMEKILNDSEKSFDEFEKTLEDFEKNQEKFGELEDYYFSEKWREDKKYDEQGKISKDIPTWVLSEDGIWNLSVRNKELGISLIKLGLKMIEKEK